MGLGRQDGHTRASLRPLPSARGLDARGPDSGAGLYVQSLLLSPHRLDGMATVEPAAEAFPGRQATGKHGQVGHPQLSLHHPSRLLRQPLITSSDRAALGLRVGPGAHEAAPNHALRALRRSTKRAWAGGGCANGPRVLPSLAPFKGLHMPGQGASCPLSQREKPWLLSLES